MVCSASFEWRETILFARGAGFSNLPMIESIAGMMKIAPIRENATAIRVVMPKLAITGNVARQSAENPKNVARPETVIAVPIFCTLSWMAAI